MFQTLTDDLLDLQASERGATSIAFADDIILCIILSCCCSSSHLVM